MSRPTERDERPAAVRCAEAGSEAWGSAAVAQRAAVPDHADFYALAAELTDTLGAARALTKTVARQVDRYADTATVAGGRVYDDTRTVDPRVRLTQAATELHSAATALATAQERVERFWSAIGHIGVEHPEHPEHAEQVDGRGAAGGVR